MPGIKLVAIDLDDTLLRDDLTISAYTREVLQRVRERGVAVTLATGRMFASAKTYADLLGFEIPLITYQGSLVKNAVSGEVIFQRELPKPLARRVITFGRRYQLQVNFYLEDRLYVERITPWGEHYAALAGVSFNRVTDLEALLNRGNPTKLVLINDERLIDGLLLELRGILEEAGLAAHLTKSKPRYLEVSHPEATKGRALQELAAWLGVRREEVMAFGDSFNDLEMLEFAGYSVAVANAHPRVRRLARYVTSSNNQDGVARALERLVLNPASRVADR